MLLEPSTGSNSTKFVVSCNNKYSRLRLKVERQKLLCKLCVLHLYVIHCGKFAKNLLLIFLLCISSEKKLPHGMKAEATLNLEIVKENLKIGKLENWRLKIRMHKPGTEHLQNQM